MDDTFTIRFDLSIGYISYKFIYLPHYPHAIRDELQKDTRVEACQPEGSRSAEKGIPGKIN